MDNQEAYTRARRRVAAKISVYIHGAAYVVGNIVLFLINMSTSPDNAWFLWPLLGWGVGLFFHTLVVFAFGEGSGVKERMIQRELRKRCPNPQ